MNAAANESNVPAHWVQNLSRLPDARSGWPKSYALAFVCAGLVHGGALFALKDRFAQKAEYGINAGNSSVEVTLVAAPPGELVPEQIVVAPEPEVLPELAETQPPPEEMPVVAEKTIDQMPQPVAVPEPIPVPQVQPSEVKPIPQAKPTPAAPRVLRIAKKASVVGDGTSATPGRDATTASASQGGVAKPGYLRNPHPIYPIQCRQQRQEGTVQLRVRVDANGRVAGISMARSSGFALLDERALSTVRDRWVFKPARVGGLATASEVIIPIRFALDNQG